VFQTFIVVFVVIAVTPVVLVYCSAHLQIMWVPHRPLGLLCPLLFHTDKLFTPHQRRFLPAEWRLSSLSSLLSIFPSLSVCAFLSSSFHPHVKVNCIPSLIQNPRIFLRCVKNKRHSLLCKLYLFTLSFFFFFFISIYFHGALIKPGNLDFKLCIYFIFLHLNKPFVEPYSAFLGVVLKISKAVLFIFFKYCSVKLRY